MAKVEVVIASAAKEQLEHLPDDVRSDVLDVLHRFDQGEEPEADPVQGPNDLVSEGWKVTGVSRSRDTGLPFAVLFRVLPGKGAGEPNRVLIGGILPVSGSKPKNWR